MTRQATSNGFRAAAIQAAIFIFSVGAAGAFVVSGGDYDIEASVVDAGGGSVLEGGEYRSQGALSQISMPDNHGNVLGGDYVNRTGFYNPPHFTFQRGRPVRVDAYSGDVTVSIPADSVDLDRFDLTMNRNPLAQPMAAEPGEIDEASGKLVNNNGPWSNVYSGNASEMTIFNEQRFFEDPLAEKGVLTLRYRDANGDGIMDGSNPPVRVETIGTWTLDDSLDMWLRLPTLGEDPFSRTLSVSFGKAGVYALIGTLADSVSSVYAFPVPFRPNGPNAGTDVGQTGTEAAGITFANIPQTGSIEIYTIDGRLVRKIEIPATLTLPKITWDVRTSAGSRAASGVYIWRAVSRSDSKTGKLMVIW